MIELKNLSKQFETLDGSVDALRNINLTIRDGDVYGIIGMSGAGKSTLVRCISRLKPWKIMVIFRRIARSSFCFSAPISLPFTSTEPSVGLSSMLIQRTRVLLPAPLMPMIP